MTQQSPTKSSVAIPIIMVSVFSIMTIVLLVIIPGFSQHNNSEERTSLRKLHGPVNYTGVEYYPGEILNQIDHAVIEGRHRLSLYEEGKTTFNDLLWNPYIIFLFYLSNSYEELLEEDADYPQEVIMRELLPSITASIRQKFYNDLLLHYNSILTSPDILHPALIAFEYGDGNYEHPDAIDLFAPEGDSIYSISRGVVVIAESTWSPNDEFSTSTNRGGNTVIIFSGTTYYRYAHLDQVSVQPGDIVASGQKIGTVGHTGKNASLDGHGDHLHIEIHTIDPADGTTTYMSNAELRKFTETIPGTVCKKDSCRVVDESR